MDAHYNKDNLLKFCSLEKLDSLISYLTEILEINKSLNLTAIRDFDDSLLLHLEDSLVAKPEVENSIEGQYLDLGCGGGFPGVPLGVATNRKSTLIDSRSKKIKAVDRAILKSGVDRFCEFETQATRIEDFSKQNKDKFAVVSARALSSLTSILELASPLLKIGGTLICLKAKIDKEELKCANSIKDVLGFSDFKIRSFTLSDGVTFREVLSVNKIKNSKLKLPRRNGLAQNSPLEPK